MKENWEGKFIKKVVIIKGKIYNLTYRSNRPSEEALQSLADEIYRLEIQKSNKVLDIS